MTLTAVEVDRIIQLLDASRFDRLSLEMDGLKLEVARSGAAPERGVAPPEIKPGNARSESASPPPPPSAPAPAAREGLLEVRSPLLGIFYRAPRPGEPPFVDVGAWVEPDTIVGIVEVMKLMNTARAGVTGEVVEIVAANGEMVEHGELLLLVRPD